MRAILGLLGVFTIIGCATTADYCVYQVKQNSYTKEPTKTEISTIDTCVTKEQLENILKQKPKGNKT